MAVTATKSENFAPLGSLFWGANNGGDSVVSFLQNGWQAHLVPDHPENEGAFAKYDFGNGYIINPVENTTPAPPAFVFSGQQYYFDANWKDLATDSNGATGGGWTSSVLSDLGFVAGAADGEYLYYTFQGGNADASAGPVTTHTLYGELDSLQFGYGGRIDDGTGGWTYNNVLLTITGLSTIGLNGGVDANGDVIGRAVTGADANDTHAIVWGLIDGNVAPLVDLLNAGSINAADGSGIQITGDLSLVGLAETTEAELALA